MLLSLGFDISMCCVILNGREHDNGLRRKGGGQCDTMTLGNEISGGSTSLSPSYRVPRTLIDIPTPPSKPRFDLSPRLGSRDMSEEPRRNMYSVLKSNSTPPRGNNHLSTAEHDMSKAVHLRGELGSNSTLQQLPFSLIQIHRDRMMMRPAKEGRRGLKCFLRFCGSMTTGMDAKAAAEAQLCNSAIKFKTDNIGKFTKLFLVVFIVWLRILI